MKNPKSFLVVAAAVVALGTGAAFTAGRLSAQPSAVANVDIRRLLDKIGQRSEMEIELTQMAHRFEQEFKSRREALETRAKESDGITDTTERQKTRDALALEQLQLKEWATMKQQEADREQALRWENLYRSIVSEADKLSASEGYQYVIVFDGNAEFQRDRRSQSTLGQQVVEQIARRRILVASNADDITEKLILRMNNARATPTPSAPTPTTTKP